MKNILQKFNLQPNLAINKKCFAIEIVILFIPFVQLCLMTLGLVISRFSVIKIHRLSSKFVRELFDAILLKLREHLNNG